MNTEQITNIETSAFPTLSDINTCLLKDQIELRNRFHAIKHRHKSGQDIAQQLDKLWKNINYSQQILAKRRDIQLALEFPTELPISDSWEEIGATIKQHQVVVLCGETGSGKSTQLPKICLALGRGNIGRIGHTQPRRIAARSLAARISQELGDTARTIVGYKVRFQDQVRPETKIKLMTDGILLAEIQRDRKLYEYDTIILDEAHERSLNIDFLLGYFKQLLPQRTDLKLIITSATIDPERFAEHFTAPIIEVSGRTYPVEVRYRLLEASTTDTKIDTRISTKSKSRTDIKSTIKADAGVGELDEDMQQAIISAVDEISLEGRGDILIFLSGEREIRETAKTLRQHRLPATEILPLYARLSSVEQNKIFAPHGARHIVLTTNVAETSLTVPGIHYVIDTGFARISRYSPRSKVQRLPIERISQAAAQQRQGRCGRVAPGICIRLYSEDNFTARRPFTEPEIQRTNLASVILQMLVLGFGKIETFPFLEPPDTSLITDGYRLLLELQAVDAFHKVTALGRQIARLPVDPRIGRILLAAVTERCLAETLVIAAALSVQDPQERPLEQREAADQIHATFHHPESDFLGVLNLWQFLEQERRQKSKNQFHKLCKRHFLSWTRIIEWRDIHQQLRTVLHEQGIKEDQAESGYDAIHRALLAGFLDNIGFRDEEQAYKGTRNKRFWIHPGSGQFRHSHKWVMVAERLQTTKDYGRTVARIRPDWIEQVGQHLLKRTYSEPHWQAECAQVAAFEKLSLLGLVVIPKRRINYGPINPAEARVIFIQGALVDQDYTTKAPFFRHNQELINSIEILEAKARRQDLLVDAGVMQAFYEARIPSGITNGPAFEKWLRKISTHDPKRLHMRMSDLLQADADTVSQEQFPDYLEFGGTKLPLIYRFEPGHPEDGITLVVPLALINKISAERCAWLVPGLLNTLIETLLRSLPKTLRKLLMPIAETAVQLTRNLTFSNRPFLTALGEAIFRLTGTRISENVWDLAALPEHLRMGFRIINDTGKILDWERDLVALQHKYGSRGSLEFANIPKKKFQQEGVTSWEFDVLPETIVLDRGGIEVQGYPAIIDQNTSVAMRVLDTLEQAELAHRAGLRRLSLFQMPGEIRRLRKTLGHLQALQLHYAKAPVYYNVNTIDSIAPTAYKPIEPPSLIDELIALIIDRAMFSQTPLPRDAKAFTACINQGRPKIFAIAQDTSILVTDLLKRYQKLRSRLTAIKQTLWQPSVQDMQEQLDGLVYRGFLQTTPETQLRHYPRYLEAVATRLERLPQGALRDRQRLQEIAPLLNKWRFKQANIKTPDCIDMRLEEIRWMLEELRISIFAQPQPTLYPISMQRIEKRWETLGL